MITKIDGTVVESKGHMLELYIYNDYTNLNIKLIDEYNLDLKNIYIELGINLILSKIIEISKL